MCRAKPYAEAISAPPFGKIKRTSYDRRGAVLLRVWRCCFQPSEASYSAAAVPQSTHIRRPICLARRAAHAHRHGMKSRHHVPVISIMKFARRRARSTLTSLVSLSPQKRQGGIRSTRSHSARRLSLISRKSPRRGDRAGGGPHQLHPRPQPMRISEYRSKSSSSITNVRQLNSAHSSASRECLCYKKCEAYRKSRS